MWCVYQYVSFHRSAATLAFSVREMHALIAADAHQTVPQQQYFQCFLWKLLSHRTNKFGLWAALPLRDALLVVSACVPSFGVALLAIAPTAALDRSEGCTVFCFDFLHSIRMNANRVLFVRHLTHTRTLFVFSKSYLLCRVGYWTSIY